MTGAGWRLALEPAEAWAALALLLALSLAGPVLPPWCWAVVLALLLWRLAGLRWPALHPGRVGRWTAAVAVLGLWAWGFWGRWVSGAAVIAFTAFVMALKWHEILPGQRRRDLMVLAGGSAVLAALGALHHLALVSLPLLLALVGALVAMLAALHGAPQPLRQAAGLLAWALPMSALLFVLSPRVPGPLWDVGLSLGLPLAMNAPPRGQGLGATDRLQPGAPRSQALEDGTVLMARFDGYRPATSELYWRGPVLWDFDGLGWTPGAGWRLRSERMGLGYARSALWREAIEGRGQPLRYELRVSGHGGPWLYALDLPGGLPPESYLTRDFQLLSMTPLREESSYQATAWLSWRERAPRLNEADRAAALAQPAQANPRLQALGRTLAARAPTPAARVQQVLAEFDPARFRLDPTAPVAAGPLGYDAFLFDTRAGAAERFAGATVLLLRAAGVPARLVTGYRGGRLMGATDYLLVKQSHAHAWVEAWLPDQGWQRLDPTDLVRPDTAQRRARVAGNAAAPDSSASGAPSAAVPPPAGASTSEAAWWKSLDEWVLHYDAQRRSQLVQGLGQQVSGQGLWWGVARLGSGLALCLLAAWAWRERRLRHQDPLLRGWALLVRRLAQAGCPVPPGECPSQLAQRLTLRPEPWAAAAAALVHEWLALRFAVGPLPPGAAEALRRRMARLRPAAFQGAPAGGGDA